MRPSFAALIRALHSLLNGTGERKAASVVCSAMQVDGMRARAVGDLFELAAMARDVRGASKAEPATSPSKHSVVAQHGGDGVSDASANGVCAPLPKSSIRDKWRRAFKAVVHLRVLSTLKLPPTALENVAKLIGLKTASRSTRLRAIVQVRGYASTVRCQIALTKSPLPPHKQLFSSSTAVREAAACSAKQVNAATTHGDSNDAKAAQDLDDRSGTAFEHARLELRTLVREALGVLPREVPVLSHLSQKSPPL